MSIHYCLTWKYVEESVLLPVYFKPTNSMWSFSSHWNRLKNEKKNYHGNKEKFYTLKSSSNPLLASLCNSCTREWNCAAGIDFTLLSIGKT